jgi:hypothetical protein
MTSYNGCVFICWTEIQIATNAGQNLTLPSSHVEFQIEQKSMLMFQIIFIPSLVSYRSLVSQKNMEI